jgi:hypothetical protein
VICSFKRYINSTSLFTYAGEGSAYGISVYKILVKYLQYFLETNCKHYNNFIRDFCLLWDQKKSILATITQLADEKHINNETTVQYRSIEEDALILRNMALYLYKTDNRNRINNMINLLNKMYENEYTIITSIVESTSKK